MCCSSHVFRETELNYTWGFPGGSVVKNPPAMQETKEMGVQSLGGEHPLEKEMALIPVLVPGKPHG